MFSNIIGHRDIKNKLSRLVENPSGTYLFYGPPSTGKKTIAIELARYMLCIGNQEEGCSCQSCSCIEHPDILCIGTQERIKVSDVDEVLNFIKLVPFLSNYKVVIIDNAETMTYEAANRLLKCIEEPASYLVFILITVNPDHLLNTIKSRCIQHRFNSISQQDLTNIFWKKMGFEPSQARVLGWIGSNSGVDIFSLAGRYLKYRGSALDFVLDLDRKKLLELLDFVDKIERKEIVLFIDMLVLVLTDLLLIKNGVGVIINADVRESLEKQANKFSEKTLIVMTNAINQTKRYDYLNVNISLVLKNAIIKCYPILQAPE